MVVNNTRPRVVGEKTSVGPMLANANTSKANNEKKESKGISEIRKMSKKTAAEAIHLRWRLSQMYDSTCRRRASHSTLSLCRDCGTEPT